MSKIIIILIIIIIIIVITIAHLPPRFGKMCLKCYSFLVLSCTTTVLSVKRKHGKVIFLRIFDEKSDE